jgi:hypothetical protein
MTLETTVESVFAPKRLTHILSVTTKGLFERSYDLSVEVYRLEE